jgi:nicotinic acid mononucleotide adenylyltransferase/nicotinamide mononucleotide (NMN) deamidase PncC
LNAERIELLFNSGFHAAFAIAGGGTGAVQSLLSTPGASRFVSDVRIPYSASALADFLGEAPEHFVCPQTAWRMAAKAYETARREGARAMGVACTAALTTDRERRGDDRAFIAIKTATSETLYSLYMSSFGRTGQERLLSDWLLRLTSQIAGTEKCLLFPGSFNPLHSGHLRLLKVAEGETGLRGLFELSKTNVDKPELIDEEVVKRVSQIRDIPVALTCAPRFVQKAELFPNSCFVVGFDTVKRVLEYAKGDEWDHFKNCGTEFLVAGRIHNSVFQGLDSLSVPAEAKDLFSSIPESLFREDISSTELRSQR